MANSAVMSESGVVVAIRERLASLTPQVIEIHDESGAHIGHEGAKGGGGHYRLLIVADAFHGQPRLARHRLIYRALGALMQREIHALAISAWTPEELARALPA